jgi:hypothetical protein
MREMVCDSPLSSGGLHRLSLGTGGTVQQCLATVYFTPHVLAETTGPQRQACHFTMADVQSHAGSRLETVKGQSCWRPTRKGRLPCEGLDHPHREAYPLASHEKDFHSHGISCRKCMQWSRFGRLRLTWSALATRLCGSGTMFPSLSGGTYAL